MEKINVLAELIVNRRSIKPAVFNGKKIDDQRIVQLLTLANWAPTHGFTEPWRFIVYSDDAVKKFCTDHAELYKLHEPPATFNAAKYDKQLHNGDTASHLIAVYMKRGSNPNITELEEICATAAAVQNILLGAEALGIAVLWSTGGLVLKPAMKQYLGLGEADKMTGLLYLGYTDEASRPGRRGAAEEKVTWRRNANND
jgi:nitroreductase